MPQEIVDNPAFGREPDRPKLPYAFKYALMAGLMASIFSLIIYFTGQEYNRALQWVGFVFPLTFLIVAMQAYKKDVGHLSWGQGFGLGMLFFVVYAVFVSVYTLLYMQVINPEYLDGMMEISMEKLEDRGMSDEAIEQAMKVSGIFMKPPMILAMGFVMNMIFGAILSAIVAAFVKKD